MPFNIKLKKTPKDNRYIKMISRRDGVCSECEDDIDEGDTIVWDAAEGKGYCETCGEDLSE